MIDTIEHFLFECNPVHVFWTQVEKWWNDNSKCPVVLTKKHVIFGLYYDPTYVSAVNYKMYNIYKQKMKEKSVHFKYFLNELKFKLEIEKSICEKNYSLGLFTKKWAAILEIL